VILFFFFLAGIPTLSFLKDRHPWNMVFTAVWSVVFAVFIAASDLPESYFLSHSLFQIMFQLNAAVALLLVFAMTMGRNEADEPALWSFGMAGTLAWVIYMTGAIIVYFVCLQEASTIGHFITSALISSLVFSWICYDAAQLCRKMSPDDYMKGVIHFYTDLFFVCLCCAFLSCVGQSGTTPT